MKPVLKIDGADFSWILNEGGIIWSRNDLDSEKTTRSQLSGEMIRKRIAIKRKLRIGNCRRMDTGQMKSLNVALMPEFIEVEYLDPIIGGVYKGTFYGSSVEATTQVYDEFEKKTYWENTSFSLTEK